jgi:cytidine deaminase
MDKPRPRTNNRPMSEPITPRTEQALVEAAQLGMRRAYTPVSGFAVGAAVLSVSGTIYPGCNVESVISGMGVCAERCAIDHAVANGEYRFSAIAVISAKSEPLSPCGMCLQYIGEFSQVAGTDITILMFGADGRLRRSSVRAMSHAIFGPDDLGLDLSRYRE